jgi:hypothetical protein
MVLERFHTQFKATDVSFRYVSAQLWKTFELNGGHHDSYRWLLPQYKASYRNVGAEQ